MERSASRIKRKLPRTGLALALLAVLALIVAFRTATTSTPPALAQATPSSISPATLKLLKIEPVKGYAGDAFTVTGDGLIPGKKVDFFWRTVDGAYITKVIPDNVEYHERKYEEKRLRLGVTSVDAQGRVNTILTAPEDFGEVHDIYAAVDGQDVGRGGFRILRSATISPLEGPIGTPITVTVKGLSW